MNYNIILAGVGGQGSLSISVVIARAAMAAGFLVKQSEVHGMSQRGGQVLAHLRIADSEIHSPTIPMGSADLVLAFEPLEALRYVSWLSADRGFVVSARTPIKNITDYPEIDAIIAEIEKLPHHIAINADEIARQAKSPRSSNMVMLGAASPFIDIPYQSLENGIKKILSDC